MKIKVLWVILIVAIAGLTIGCSNPTSSSSSEDVEEAGKIDLSIFMYFSSITSVVDNYDYLVKSATSFYRDSVCIELETKITIYGESGNSKTYEKSVCCSLGEYLDNMDSYVEMDSDYFYSTEFDPGYYNMKIEQSGSYGVSFWRQDVSSSQIEYAYFDFIGMPISLSFEIKSGQKTAIDLYIYQVSFDHFAY